MNKVDRFFAIFSSNLLLFMTCAGIWGSSWLVIKFQLTSADPVASVFYRFLISSSILFLFAFLTGRNLGYSRTHHLNFFLQGACNFSINYIITYWAEMHAPSALIAVTFTLLVAYNILGMKIFFKKAIHPRVYIGAILGLLGVGLIFKHELENLGLSGGTIKGLTFGLIATLFASAGNLLAYRNHLQKVPVTIANTWGMFYGMLTSLFLGLVLQKSFAAPVSQVYWLSQFYLAIFATVIAFGAYLTLVGKIGAERAGYSSIISPVIAVSLSILFEDFRLTPSVAFGLLLCILGVFVTNYAGGIRFARQNRSDQAPLI